MFHLYEKGSIKVKIPIAKDQIKCSDCLKIVKCEPFFNLEDFCFINKDKICVDCIEDYAEDNSNLKNTVSELNNYEWHEIEDNYFILKINDNKNNIYISRCCVSYNHKNCSSTFLVFGGLHICFNYLRKDSDLERLSNKKQVSFSTCQFCGESPFGEEKTYYDFGVASSDLCEDCYNEILEIIRQEDKKEILANEVLINI